LMVQSAQNRATENASGCLGVSEVKVGLAGC
jgi:hypothetical protein